MKAMQLWLNLGILAGTIWTRIHYDVGKLFNFYDESIGALGLPLGESLLNLGASPMAYFIGNQWFDSDRVILFIGSAVWFFIVAFVLMLWLLVDVIYWLTHTKRPYKHHRFIKRFNLFCWIIYALYCLEWLLAFILSNVYVVPMFGYPMAGMYMPLLVGIIKVYGYYQKTAFATK